jgi:hypothetical protein
VPGLKYFIKGRPVFAKSDLVCAMLKAAVFVTPREHEPRIKTDAVSKTYDCIGTGTMYAS